MFGVEDEYKKYCIFVYKNEVISTVVGRITKNMKWNEFFGVVCLLFNAPQKPEEYRLLDIKNKKFLNRPSIMNEMKLKTVVFIHKNSFEGLDIDNI